MATNQRLVGALLLAFIGLCSCNNHKNIEYDIDSIYPLAQDNYENEMIVRNILLDDMDDTENDENDEKESEQNHVNDFEVDKRDKIKGPSFTPDINDEIAESDLDMENSDAGSEDKAIIEPTENGQKYSSIEPSPSDLKDSDIEVLMGRGPGEEPGYDNSALAEKPKESTGDRKDSLSRAEMDKKKAGMSEDLIKLLYDWKRHDSGSKKSKEVKYEVINRKTDEYTEDDIERINKLRQASHASSYSSPTTEEDVTSTPVEEKTAVKPPFTTTEAVYSNPDAAAEAPEASPVFVTASTTEENSPTKTRKVISKKSKGKINVMVNVNINERAVSRSHVAKLGKKFHTAERTNNGYKRTQTPAVVIPVAAAPAQVYQPVSYQQAAYPTQYQAPAQSQASAQSAVPIHGNAAQAQTKLEEADVKEAGSGESGSGSGEEESATAMTKYETNTSTEEREKTVAGAKPKTNAKEVEENKTKFEKNQSPQVPKVDGDKKDDASDDETKQADAGEKGDSVAENKKLAENEKNMNNLESSEAEPVTQVKAQQSQILAKEVEAEVSHDASNTRSQSLLETHTDSLNTFLHPSTAQHLVTSMESKGNTQANTQPNAKQTDGVIDQMQNQHQQQKQIPKLEDAATTSKTSDEDEEEHVEAFKKDSQDEAEEENAWFGEEDKKEEASKKVSEDDDDREENKESKYGSLAQVREKFKTWENKLLKNLDNSLLDKKVKEEVDKDADTAEPTKPETTVASEESTEASVTPVATSKSDSSKAQPVDISKVDEEAENAAAEKDAKTKGAAPAAAAALAPQPVIQQAAIHAQDADKPADLAQSWKDEEKLLLAKLKNPFLDSEKKALESAEANKLGATAPVPDTATKPTADVAKDETAPAVADGTQVTNSDVNNLMSAQPTAAANSDTPQQAPSPAAMTSSNLPGKGISSMDEVKNYKQLQLFKTQIQNEVKKIDNLKKQYQKESHSTKDLDDAKAVLEKDLKVVKQLEKNLKKKKKKSKSAVKFTQASEKFTKAKEASAKKIASDKQNNYEYNFYSKKVGSEHSESDATTHKANSAKKHPLEQIHTLLKAEIRRLKKSRHGKNDKQLSNIRKLVQHNLKKLISSGSLNKLEMKSLTPEIKELGNLLKKQLGKGKKSKKGRKHKQSKFKIDKNYHAKAASLLSTQPLPLNSDTSVTSMINGGSNDHSPLQSALNDMKQATGLESNNSSEPGSAIPGSNNGNNNNKNNNQDNKDNMSREQLKATADHMNKIQEHFDKIATNPSVNLDQIKHSQFKNLLSSLNSKLGEINNKVNSLNAQRQTENGVQQMVPTLAQSKDTSAQQNSVAPPAPSAPPVLALIPAVIPATATGSGTIVEDITPQQPADHPDTNVRSSENTSPSAPASAPAPVSAPVTEITASKPDANGVINIDIPMTIDPSSPLVNAPLQDIVIPGAGPITVGGKSISGTDRAVDISPQKDGETSQRQEQVAPPPQPPPAPAPPPPVSDPSPPAVVPPSAPAKPQSQASKVAEVLTPKDTLEDAEEDNPQAPVALADDEPVDTLVENLEKDITEVWSYRDIYPDADKLGLDNERVHNTYANLGSLSGLNLRRALNRALRGDDVGLAIVGGSISKGGPFSEKGLDFVLRSYFYAVEDWWNKIIRPVTGSSMIIRDVSIGGIATDYYSYCLQNHLPDDKLTNIVIWELSANDMRRYEDVGRPKPQALEQFTRNVLSYRAKPALLYLNFFALFDWDKDLSAHCRNFEDEGEDDVAKYYKITSLSWRNMVCPLLKAGDNPLFSKEKLFAEDNFHPAILGHAQMAYIVIDYIRTEFLKNLVKMRNTYIADAVSRLQIPKAVYIPRPMFAETYAWKPLCYTYMLVDNRSPNNTLYLTEENASAFRYTVVREFKIRSDKIVGMDTSQANQVLHYKLHVPGHTVARGREQVPLNAPYLRLGIMSFTDDKTAEVQFDNEPIKRIQTKKKFLEGTTIKYVAEKVTPGEHELSIRSGPNGFLVSAIVLG